MASLPDPTFAHPAFHQRAVPPDQASLAGLLQFEADVRRQGSVAELIYLIANETRRIVDYGQLFVAKLPRIGDGFQIAGASSLAVIDRNAPLLHGIEKALAKISPGPHWAQDVSDDPSVIDYPFHAWQWQPLLGRDGQAFAGLLFVRAEPMREGETIRIERVAETISHSWRALTGDKPVRRLPKITRTQKRLLWAAGLLVALFPVQMTALAPVEVVPARPFVVSAPYPGVIARIEVAPNTMVKVGQPVLTFEDIKVRNDMQQAAEKLQVARARIERATSAAFGKAEEAREIATMRAEFDVARAEYDYARDLLAKSQITAPVGGMAIYSDRRDWEGRAVNAGDPILQIAAPREVLFRIDLPAKEQMALSSGSAVKIWLDAQPLWALSGKIEQASYLARPTAEGVLAFAVTARPVGDIPRIGSRGTAKLYGQWVPFAYSIFKRPIASVRQFFGV